MTRGLKMTDLSATENYSIFKVYAMSRFTRWKSRQKARQFQESFLPLGTVVNWNDEMRMTGIADFRKMQIMIASKVSERIMRQALGGIVKPERN